MNWKSLFLASLSGGCVVLFSGCASNRVGYIDTGGTQTIVSLDKINIQDWQNAANQMVDSLLTSGVLERAPHQPAVLAISRIINNTQEIVDTDYLVKKIRIRLNRSGKVMTTTTTGLGGRAEDPLAKSQAEYNAFVNDQKPQTAVAKPDYSLSGKLLEDRVRSGRTKQVTYTFQLSLTDIRTGLAVWENEVPITKQGKRSSVGW